LLSQVRRVAEHPPFFGAGSQHAGLRRDEDAVGVRAQRPSDQPLCDVRAVGGRGVGGIDTQVYRAPPDPNAFVPSLPRSPNALTGQTHGAEAEAVDREIAADGECSGLLSDALSGHFSTVRPQWQGVPVKLGALAALPLTYTEVGATAGPLPEGFKHLRK